MTATVIRGRRLGMIGSIVGFVALVAAVLPQWVMPVLFPPPPVDQVIVDVGHKVKERLAARIKGTEYQPAHQEPALRDRVGHGLEIAAVSLGLAAIGFAVFALFFREEKPLAAASAALGVAAIAVEISFLVLGALVLIAIVYAVLDHIDLF